MTERMRIDWHEIAKETGSTRGRLAYSDMVKSWVILDGNGEADMCVVTCPLEGPGVRIERDKSDGKWYWVKDEVLP